MILTKSPSGSGKSFRESFRQHLDDIAWLVSDPQLGGFFFNFYGNLFTMPSRPWTLTMRILRPPIQMGPVTITRGTRAPPHLSCQRGARGLRARPQEHGHPRLPPLGLYDCDHWDPLPTATLIILIHSLFSHKVSAIFKC